MVSVSLVYADAQWVSPEYASAEAGLVCSAVATLPCATSAVLSLALAAIAPATWGQLGASRYGTDAQRSGHCHRPAVALGYAESASTLRG